MEQPQSQAQAEAQAPVLLQAKPHAHVAGVSAHTVSCCGVPSRGGMLRRLSSAYMRAAMIRVSLQHKMCIKNV